ncbi:hypothetical protein [Nodularia sp. UHCC 0506]|uniref:hypothetical protein n=1 Tax=Nodularia sp. UHCC 0506 TaxID=3110243 RepID=UPI00139AD0F1|nr:hypothetical protein [Nodularia sp. UHCC 0506]MEA5516739.1 hypothetical protein [Nodularia sp. UHCC 0506]TVP60100.1 MAG: hypothetical protein EA343_18365 [Nodularia sp. (in: cyanobacteria)]
MARNDIATRFKSKGIGVKSDTKPISVMLPEDLDAYVRSKSNRSEWLRRVIAEAAAKEQAEASQED